MSTRTRTTYRAITAGALLGASSPAALVCAAPYEAPGDLTGDVPVSGLSLFGVDPRAEFGRAAASAGDFNGDGFDDIIVGAPFGDPGCRDDAGQAFVVFGGPDVDANGNLLSLEFFDTIAGVRINGAFPGDLLGFDLAGGGDLNADGIDDLLIGASEAYSYAFTFGNSLPHCDGSELRLGPLFVNRLGEAHVIFGAPSPCSAADLDTPFGLLDLADLQAFTDAFLAGAPAADLDASGVVDLADIALFVSGFLAGCP